MLQHAGAHPSTCHCCPAKLPSPFCSPRTLLESRQGTSSPPAGASCHRTSLPLGVMVTLRSRHHPQHRMENRINVLKTPWCSGKPGPGGLKQAAWDTSLPNTFREPWPLHNCLYLQQSAGSGHQLPLPRERGGTGSPLRCFLGIWASIKPTGVILRDD